MGKDINKAQVIQYNQMLLPTMRALKHLGGSANIDELNAKVICSVLSRVIRMFNFFAVFHKILV